MKAFINGKRFDTDAHGSVKVAYASHGAPGDFSHVRETLYRTTRGAWFLAGCGGPASKYSRSAGQNCWSGGEKIIPLDTDAALSWLESEGNNEAIEKWFSSTITDA